MKPQLRITGYEASILELGQKAVRCLTNNYLDFEAKELKDRLWDDAHTIEDAIKIIENYCEIIKTL